MAKIICLGAFLLGVSAAVKQKPNVVLIVADDYGKVDFLKILLLVSARIDVVEKLKKVITTLVIMAVRSRHLIWTHLQLKKEYDSKITTFNRFVHPREVNCFQADIKFTLGFSTQ